MQVGLVIIDEDPAVALRVARQADKAGIHSVWTIDYYNRSSLARAAAFAAVTESAIVGTSVTPLFARAPLALASAASDVRGIAGDRFVLGVGSSTRRMNADWYGAALDHPAPQMRERIGLLRQLVSHRTGPFSFHGQFEKIDMAHFDRPALPSKLQILAAGVGKHMVAAAAECADGFVGHPIASAHYLRTQAYPLLEKTLVSAGRDSRSFVVSTQIIASASQDRRAARLAAAYQVGFYSTVKGYDPLFTDGMFLDERQAAREAFAQGDPRGVAAAAHAMVDDRAVYGHAGDITEQLHRYTDIVDWALLYPPHYGVDSDQITANEMALIEVASCWTS